MKFRVVVGPLPDEAISRRSDGNQFLAMIVVTHEASGKELIADVDIAPTAEGAKAKGEGLAAHFTPEHPAFEDALRFIETGEYDDGLG